MAVAPRQNLAPLFLSRTWALHGGRNRLDQMMALTSVALHPLAFSFCSTARAGHHTFLMWSTWQRALALFTMVLLAARLGVILGKRAESGGRRDLGISILPAPFASSELIRKACTGVFHLDKGSYRMPPAWSSLPFICRSGQARTRVLPNCHLPSHRSRFH